MANPSSPETDIGFAFFRDHLNSALPARPCAPLHLAFSLPFDFPTKPARERQTLIHTDRNNYSILGDEICRTRRLRVLFFFLASPLSSLCVACLFFFFNYYFRSERWFFLLYAKVVAFEISALLRNFRWIASAALLLPEFMKQFRCARLERSVYIRIESRRRCAAFFFGFFGR